MISKGDADVWIQHNRLSLHLQQVQLLESYSTVNNAKCVQDRNNALSYIILI